MAIHTPDQRVRVFVCSTMQELAPERSGTGGHRASPADAGELAERGNAALGTAGQVEWRGRLDRENDNFRAVLRHALRREDAASALRMGRALASYWYSSDSCGEGRGWMEQVAELPNAQPYERATARTIVAIEAFCRAISGRARPAWTTMLSASRPRPLRSPSYYKRSPGVRGPTTSSGGT